MSRAGDTAIAAEVQHRRRVVVDVILLLMRNGRILLRERANTGYGDGAYEPPTGQLADRETIVETAIRVAAAEAGIAIQAENVSLAHVMHDVSGSGRIGGSYAPSPYPVLARSRNRMRPFLISRRMTSTTTLRRC